MRIYEDIRMEDSESMGMHTQRVALTLTVALLLGCSNLSQKPEVIEMSDDSYVSAEGDKDQKEEPQESSVSVSDGDINDEDVSVESDSSYDTAEPEPTEAAKNGRPVITHRYSTIILCHDFPAISNYMENVISVTDPEDGELPYYNIGGIAGSSDYVDEYNLRHPKDNPEAVANHGSPFYFSMGFNYLNGGSGTVPVVTVGYDSQGQVSYLEYRIIYVGGDPNEAIKEATVLVDGLRVRKIPSTSGEMIGNVWKNAHYYIYESVEKDGYTWYRIGDDMWIADDGNWVELNS